MFKKILLSISVVIVALVIWQWELVNYASRMGWGQLKIIWDAKPVEVFLRDPKFPDSLKTKLHLIGEIRLRCQPPSREGGCAQRPGSSCFYF